MSKKILITGASGGFGKLTVKTLLQKGHQVCASMRNVNGKNKEVAQELESAGAKVVEINVTNEASVNAGIASAIKQLGGLDVVINNAGIGVLGLQESFTIEDWKKLFDINVYGVQRINRAVLPYLRKRNSGLLIFISSLLGRITVPFYGPYNASKWAVEAMAENYRIELSSIGVDVCVIEPGGYPTSFMNNLLKPDDLDRNESYGEMAQAPIGFFNGFEQALASNPAQNPQNVAEAIANVIDTPAGQRKFRTVVDKMGMGEPVAEYNNHLEQITSAIYNNFGIGDMLKLNV